MAKCSLHVLALRARALLRPAVAGVLGVIAWEILARLPNRMRGYCYGVAAARALLVLPVTILLGQQLASHAQAKLLLGESPKGWEDFDSYWSAAYNESFARAAARAVQHQLLPSGYDNFIIGGWSMGGLLLPGGKPDPNATDRYTVLDEYGRPNPDAGRFPSANVGGGDGTNDCVCERRNCTNPASYSCTDPVCVCKAGTRSLRPLASYLNDLGLRLGLWTWRGVHYKAAKKRLKVKGTQYTIDEIVDRNPDGSACTDFVKPMPDGHWQPTHVCPGACTWGPWLGVNASHPGAQAYYDSLYELFISEWMVEFVKADCEDAERRGELLAQADAVKKQPLIKGIVRGSSKPRSMALSLSPGPMDKFGNGGADGTSPNGFGAWLAENQVATMYRVTTDYHGGIERTFGEKTQPGGSSIAEAELHANASLIAANGTFPDLDMVPMGQLHCGATASLGQQCGCNNCNGSNLAYVLMSVWCISRSPILLGSTLPADAVTASLLTNKDLLYVHAYARNQTVFTSYETNTSCTEATVPACGWNNSGWTKWWADLARPTDTSILKSVAQNSVGSVETTASPPIKVVLVVNVGYGVPKTGAAHTVEKTFTGWHDLGLDVGGSKLYTARDVFSRRRLSSNTSGFVVNLSRFNATLVLISEASKGGTDAR
jgi:alpha-galactosidase